MIEILRPPVFPRCSRVQLRTSMQGYDGPQRALSPFGTNGNNLEQIGTNWNESECLGTNQTKSERLRQKRRISPMGFLCFSYAFSMLFLCFRYGCTMDVLWVCYV